MKEECCQLVDKSRIRNILLRLKKRTLIRHRHIVVKKSVATIQQWWYSITSQFTTSKFTILTDSRFHIYFLKNSNSRILKNPSQFTDFLYYMHNKDPGNWEENSELGVVRLHNFNSQFPIHGKFLVPKNVNWEVTL